MRTTAYRSYPLRAVYQPETVERLRLWTDSPSDWDPHCVGQGANGRAWKIGREMVLKVTSDPVEATLSNLLCGRGVPGTAKIYKVARMPLNDSFGDYFLILQEYLPKRLKWWEETLLSDFLPLFREVFKRSLGRSYVPDWNSRYTVRKIHETAEDWYGKGTRVTKIEPFKGWRPVVDLIIQAHQELQAAGAPVLLDICGSNGLKRNSGEIALIDFGACCAPGPDLGQNTSALPILP